jgi:hypothetical protein
MTTDIAVHVRFGGGPYQEKDPRTAGTSPYDLPNHHRTAAHARPQRSLRYARPEIVESAHRIPRITAGTRAQAPPAMLAERHGRRGSQATWSPALSLSAAVPVGYGPCAESPASDLLWRLAAGTALWGFNSVSWGFNSAARSSGPVCEAAAAVRELPGSSGRLSPCFP